jgi:hypothetical protein
LKHCENGVLNLIFFCTNVAWNLTTLSLPGGTEEKPLGKKIQPRFLLALLSGQLGRIPQYLQVGAAQSVQYFRLRKLMEVI